MRTHALSPIAAPARARRRARRATRVVTALAAVIGALSACGPFVLYVPLLEEGVADLGVPDAGSGEADASATSPDASDGAIVPLDDAGTDGGGDAAAVPVIFDITYCWSSVPGDSFDFCPTAWVTLLDDGTYTDDMGLVIGRWWLLMGGTRWYMDVDGATYSYDGALQPSGCFEGTMSNNLPVGPAGIWRGCHR